ncbi:MAG: SPOR domain-containing protein [Treponema sp.]|nr:SPOR domain-containing protein [Treponema sp.]
MFNKKLLICLLISLFTLTSLFAQLKAKDIADQAAKEDNVEASINYVKNQIPKVTDSAQKRALYIFLASLQEQMAYYQDAQKSYVSAAGIKAGDVEGMPKKSNEEMVLAAVRCALSSGDYESANSYLNSSVRNSKSQEVQAYIKLYSQWSLLCRAETSADLQEPFLLLQTYTKLDNMIAVQPAILLTLWYLSGEKSYSNEILKKFPKSVEAAIVNGDVQLLPTPFWFFVPKSGEAEQGTGSYVTASLPEESKSSAKKENSDSNEKISKYQLGLFRTQANADALAEEVKAKGFDAYVISEVRPSGTTYYIVLVNEDSKGNIADRLRSSGYDCYGLE